MSYFDKYRLTFKKEKKEKRGEGGGGLLFLYATYNLKI